MCATRIPTQQRIRPNNNVSFLSVLSWISIPPNSICHVVLRSHRQTGVHRGPVHWCAPCAVRTSDEGKIEKLAVITIISRDGGRYTYFLMDIEDKLGTKTFRIVYRQYAMPEGVKRREITAGAACATVVAPKFSLLLFQSGMADFALPLQKLHQKFSRGYISEKGRKMSQ